MSKRVRISDRVDYVGSQDWDREIFDSLIPLPDGTSYNSYVVKGSEKVALIDTVDPKFGRELEGKLKGIEKVDYVVINHEDALQATVDQVVSIIKAEKSRVDWTPVIL